MLEKTLKYFDREYQEMKNWFENSMYSLPKETKRVAVTNAISRCLGVAMFVQDWGVTYEDVSKPFEETKLKLMALLEEEE